MDGEEQSYIPFVWTPSIPHWHFVIRVESKVHAAIKAPSPVNFSKLPFGGPVRNPRGSPSDDSVRWFLGKDATILEHVWNGGWRARRR
ncbi:hypothetical protein HJFPF1_12813 [Paramyrothecium foliicola]|nr:hypothetical protein HJFPF1_12813 [Paramyrothecium foliicola]